MPTNYVHFRASRVVKATTRWYVEYYYRVPPELLDQHGHKEWKRFRVFEDINRYKTDEYADLLCKAVLQALQDGYNPFHYQREKRIKERIVSLTRRTSLNMALDRITTCIVAGSAHMRATLRRTFLPSGTSLLRTR